jgi:hypothetical protein
MVLIVLKIAGGPLEESSHGIQAGALSLNTEEGFVQFLR